MFMLRVALRCGFPSIRHFEEQYGDMTSSEVMDLMAADRLDPPIGPRVDYLVALLCTVVANSRLAGKGAKSYKPADFLIEWSGKRKKRRQSEAEMVEVLKQFR